MSFTLIPHAPVGAHPVRDRVASKVASKGRGSERGRL